MIERTKNLTIARALKLLQLKYGTQIKQVTKEKGRDGITRYFVNDCALAKTFFTKPEIIEIENEIYAGFGC